MTQTVQETGPGTGGRVRAVVPIAVVLAVLAGGLLAFQTRVNGALGASIGDGLVAAALVFAIGLILTIIGLLFSRRGRGALRQVIPLVRAGELAPWMLLGGAIASVFVIAQGLAAAILGTALFTVSAVAGQTISGLVVDRLGIGPGGSRPITIQRLAGAVLCLLAVVWAVAAHITNAVPLWLILLPLVGGATVSWQQAVNGRVRAATTSALAATFVNFLTGTVVVAAVAVIHGIVAGFPASLPTNPLLYAGGVSAVIFIAATTVLVRFTGVLILGLCTVAGQLIVSLVLDAAGPGAVGIDATTVAATAIALVAAVVASLPSRYRTSRGKRAAGTDRTGLDG